MAVLKIYNDIADEETKAVKYWFTGVDSVCFKDIDDFLSSIPEDDKTIDIKMNCPGGSVAEGWAMYDKLRDSGKEIMVTVEGLCASMATVLLLAAPVGKRYGLPNSEYLIHEPYIPPYTLDGAYRADDLRTIADQLQESSDKILNLYVERTGADRDELLGIMEQDKCISVSEAKRLGFINEVKVPSTARANNNHNQKSMNKEVKVKQGILGRLLSAAGYAKIDDVPDPVCMDLTTEDGTTLTIEREEGEPEVGDPASPDGTHKMPDGSTIVVTDGAISEIIPAEETEVDKLNARIAELEGQLATAKANARTSGDAAILNAVKMAGGEKFLAQHCSTYKVKNRSQSRTTATFDESPIAKELRERKEGTYNKNQK